jgi:(R,R)-butanediol dehydrogenase / meso-butanediol dehydrogenase / diacetyl reductase
MRAAVIGSDGAFEVETVDDPAPGPGELVVRVTACGVCGSDLKARPAMPGGTVMGHEFCGEVVAVGAGAEPRWKEGARAAVLPVFSCGSCAWCLAGDVAHCADARLIGLGGGGGGFAEYAVVSSALSFEVPADLPESFGALVEPFAVGLHTVRAAGVGSGDDVLIIGAGPVGLTTARWSKALGAKRVVVSDPVAVRRAMSEGFGATAVVDPTTDELGHGFDVVIDCVGKPGLLDRCVDAVATKGRIVVAGVCTEPDPYLPMLALLKEVTIGFAVYYRPEEFETVIAAFADERIDPSGLVTDTVGLDQLDSAFDRLVGSPTDAKILIDPRVALGSEPVGSGSVEP